MILPKLSISQLWLGRAYDYNIQTDDSLALVVNETFVKSMNWGSPQDAIGERFYYQGELRGQIVGVVKDYNFCFETSTNCPTGFDT